MIRSTFLSPTLTSPIKPSNTAPPPTSCSPPSTSPTGATSVPSPTPTPAAAPTSLTTSEYQEKLEHWREVAKILRENIVQGEAIQRERAEQQQQAEAESAAREQAGSLEMDGQAVEEDAPVYRKLGSPVSRCHQLLTFPLPLLPAPFLLPPPRSCYILLHRRYTGLRLTPHTELGDNDTIRLKTPPKLETVPFPNRNDAARERRRAEREKRIREREEQK